MINALALHLIKHFEKLRLETYLDAGKRPTIGWGHLVTNEDPDEWLTPGFQMTLEEANELLQEDLQKATQAVDKNVTVPLNENEYGALVSFAYNIGATAFRTSGALRALNSGNKEQFLLRHAGWVNVDGERTEGLVVRRAVERYLFTAPVMRGGYTVNAGTVDESVLRDLAAAPKGTHIVVLQPTPAAG